MNIRKIIAVTGIRSEYYYLYPLIKKLEKNGFIIKLIVSGGHLSDWHNNSLQTIKDDGFEIVDKVDSLFTTNRNTQRVKGIGALVTGISQCVEREQPDLLLYIGDREEGIATALVGNYMNVLFAHLAGGDSVYGNADDPIRFAISKLAHIHFPQAEQYANNLRNIGEENFRIFNVGSTSLDYIRKTKVMSIDQINRSLGTELVKDKYLVLLKHPLSSEYEDTSLQMQITLDCVSNFCSEFDFNLIGIYPNTDPGSYDIISEIGKYKDNPKMNFFKNLAHLEFVNILRNASALIGNSSMGILEAPYYKLPVINIGNRQKGRLNAGNVEFVKYDKDLILKSLYKACFDNKYRKKISNLFNPYGDGHASDKIVKILSSIDINDRKWYVKQKLC